jgi:hypothetical protein
MKEAPTYTFNPVASWIDWSVLQVRATVDSEFTNLEQEATAKKPRSSLPRSGREGGAKFSRLDMKVLLPLRSLDSKTFCLHPF